MRRPAPCVGPRRRQPPIADYSELWNGLPMVFSFSEQPAPISCGLLRIIERATKSGRDMFTCTPPHLDIVSASPALRAGSFCML